MKRVKKIYKELIWLIILLTLLTISAFSQNQFSDYVKHIETQEAPKLDKFINEWIGIPYKLGGKTKKGIDCSQFTKRLYRDVYSLELKDVAYKQWSQTNRIPKTNLIIGDIVFFNSRISPSGWHCGIYIGNDKFVHAANKSEGVKISSLNEPKYKKSYKGAGRL
jgi:lipoprotein Spr